MTDTRRTQGGGTPELVSWDPRDQYRWLGPLAGAVLVIGASMAAFGLPPVDLHGPLHYLGIMDPLCGGTRGVRLALRGDLGGAWRYNPLSIPVVAAALVALVRHAFGSVTGRWVTLRIARPWPLLITGAVLLAALEVNQQAHADLLRTGPGTAPLSAMIFYFAPRIALAAGGVWLLYRRGRRRTPGRTVSAGHFGHGLGGWSRLHPDRGRGDSRSP